jgi:hypothetical protein
MQRRLAVILSALLLTGAQSALAEPSQTSFHEEAYREAIRRAAIKTPELTKSVRLATIDDDLPAVTVIRLAKNDPVEECHGDPSKECRLRRDTWVSLPAELLVHCRGKPDALLALQQVLGLPPYAEEHKSGWAIYQFTVRPKDMFRPCASGARLTDLSCSNDVSNASAEVRSFVFEQMWTSYRTGFDRPGFPFTGMGWSYNWSPDSQDHVGISEFVVREEASVLLRETEMKFSTRMTPSEFCSVPDQMARAIALN